MSITDEMFLTISMDIKFDRIVASRSIMSASTIILASSYHKFNIFGDVNHDTCI